MLEPVNAFFNYTRAFEIFPSDGETVSVCIVTGAVDEESAVLLLELHATKDNDAMATASASCCG